MQKVKSTMDVQSEKPEGKELTLRECFDQVLARHMDRLIGTSIGIGGLPLNLLNVASLILLTEQITEELENFSSPSERYTRSTLFDELSEMGMTFEEDTENLLDDMVEKDYVEMDQEGGLSAKKPTISMAQLLDRVFPKMPGLNLIASLAQTMDEVRGGSKDLESSVSRFDQILKMQGVPLISDEPGPKDEKGIEQSSSGSAAVSNESPWGGVSSTPIAPPQKQKLSDRYSIQPQRTSLAASPAPSAAADLPTETGSVDADGRERDTASSPLQMPPFPETAPATEPPEAVHSGEQGLEEHPVDTTSPASDPVPERAAPQTEVGDDDTGLGAPGTEAPSPAGETPSPDAGPPMQDMSIETTGTEEVSQANTPIPEEDPLHETDLQTDDRDIERRIAEFENALTLQCPICETGVIGKETTSTGKQFYKCTTGECNFISWGKPFHIACPQCRNPFLVEATGRDGILILKCPRATCAHWQKHPLETERPAETMPGQPTRKLVRVRRGSGKGKKKAVRRRVVKRKH